VLITTLSLADNIDDFVVFFLQERCYLFEVAQTSKARFSLARARHAMASADDCHLVSDSRSSCLVVVQIHQRAAGRASFLTLHAFFLNSVCEIFAKPHTVGDVVTTTSPEPVFVF